MSDDAAFTRFLFEALDIRGAVVRLGPAWRAMRQGRNYAPAVAGLLGEMTAVTTIIAGQLKTPGRLTVQMSGAGPLRRLVIDCDESLRLRGMARSDASLGEIMPAAPRQLLGDGQLALTLDLPELRQPFQSIVRLDGDSIAEIFEHYLEQSEQQPARLFLAASDNNAGGLFLQKLPDADQRDADGWNRVTQLAATIRPEELCELDAIPLLRRLFVEEDLRVYPPRAPSYHCPRDVDKVRAMLRALGRAEVEATLAEHGEVVVVDDICNQTYRFDQAAIAELFDGDQRLH